MNRSTVLIQVLFAFWMGVLITQFTVDDSGQHFTEVLVVGAIGTVSFIAAHALMAFVDSRGTVQESTNDDKASL